LADGTGNVRYQTNVNGAVSFDGTNYGNVGQVLKSNSTAGSPTWANENAQRYVNVNVTNGIGAQDAVTFADASAGNMTLTLPAAAGNGGLTLSVKRVDSVSANILTIASAGGTIEGLVTQQIGPSVAVIYCSDGTNWWELANG